MMKNLPFLGEIADHVRLCLVRESGAIEAAVRLSCTGADECEVFPLDGLLNEQNALSELGNAVVEAARQAEVVLFEWKLESAPVVNTLGFHLRREHAAPLVALCRGGQDEWIAALAAGADCAVSFPLNLPLLRAFAVSYHRLAEGVLAEQTTAPDAAEEVVQETAEARHDVRRFGDLRLDRTAHRFYIRDVEVELTPREFALLTYLIENVGTALSRDQILDAVWGINFDTGTNMVDVYMYFLRRKLESHGITGIIQTVRGVGYRLASQEPTEA